MAVTSMQKICEERKREDEALKLCLLRSALSVTPIDNPLLRLWDGHLSLSESPVCPKGERPVAEKVFPSGRDPI